MRSKIVPLIVSCLSALACLASEDAENVFSGKWVVVPASSPASFLFEFKENGRVINETNKTVGTYELLKNNRVLIEFTGEILIMEYYPSDGSIMLNGLVGMQPQQISLTLIEPTEENRKEVQETYATRFKAQQDAIQRMQRQAVEVAIKNNLRQFASAAQMYLLENGVSAVSYTKLVEEDYMQVMEPVNGESYEDLYLDMETSEIMVMDAGGTPHRYVF